MISSMKKGSSKITNKKMIDRIEEIADEIVANDRYIMLSTENTSKSRDV